MPKEVTHEMLAAAMKKAVETGLVAKGAVDTETYMKNWDAMKASIQAALDAAE